MLSHRAVRLGARWLALAGSLALCGVATAQQSARTEPPLAPDLAGEEPLFSVDSPVGEIEYVAARGLRLGDTGLTIGGFTTLEIDREEGEPGVIEIDGVSFLVLFEPFDFLRGFAEIEVGQIFAVETNDDDVRSDPDPEIERLYVDLSRSDALNLRFGKFLTPVGRWNLVPAEPFVWTASEPVLVETAFDEHQTGGALFGSVHPAGRSVSWWLYGQFLDPLDPSEDPAPADRSVGGRLEAGGALGEWSLGTSFLASERRHDWSFLGGLDALWRIGPLELQGELAVVDGDIPGRKLWGIYAQGVYDLGDLHPCLRNLYAVGRYEHFDPWGSAGDADIGDLGLAWLPVPYLNIKVGYRLSDRETEDVRRGLTASVSVLF